VLPIINRTDIILDLTAGRRLHQGGGIGGTGRTAAYKGRWVREPLDMSPSTAPGCTPVSRVGRLLCWGSSICSQR
jgi:hypothetical protein